MEGIILSRSHSRYLGWAYVRFYMVQLVGNLLNLVPCLFELVYAESVITVHSSLRPVSYLLTPPMATVTTTPALDSIQNVISGVEETQQ